MKIPANTIFASRRRRIAAAAALAAALATVVSLTTGGASAGRSAAADSKTIGISFPNATKEGAVQQEMKYAQAKAKKLGYTLVIDDPGQDLNHQLNTINTWIQQHFHAIVVVALNPGAFGNTVKKARAAGVAWFTYGSDLPGQTGAINLEQLKGGNTIGQLAGNWLKKNVKGTAKIALLTYESGAWARAREQGVMQGLQSTHLNFKIVAKQDALSESEGLSVTTPMLNAHPDLNAVLAIEETASEGAYQALINKHYKPNTPTVFLGGIDGTLRALELLKQGNTMYRGSAALSLRALGEGMVTTLARASGSYHVTYTPLTPGNANVGVFLHEWGK